MKKLWLDGYLESDRTGYERVHIKSYGFGDLLVGRKRTGVTCIGIRVSNYEYLLLEKKVALYNFKEWKV